MNEEMLFQQMKFYRERTVALLDATPEDLAAEIPDGFKNNLLWNFGHIYVSQDILLYSFAGEKLHVDPVYMELFKMNSQPGEWTKEPPSLQEIRQLLVEQPARIIDSFSGRLAEVGEKPFQMTSDTTFTTLGEVLGFANFHEGIHQGAITGLKRALGVEDLWTPVT